MANTIPVGASVNVVRGISDTEKQLAKHPERIYTLDRYTNPHGYAAITDEYGTWLVHPEALGVVEPTCPKAQEMRTAINGKPTIWPDELAKLWHTFVDDADPKISGITIAFADYSTQEHAFLYTRGDGNFTVRPVPKEFAYGS